MAARIFWKLVTKNILLWDLLFKMRLFYLVSFPYLGRKRLFHRCFTFQPKLFPVTVLDSWHVFLKLKTFVGSKIRSKNENFRREYKTRWGRARVKTWERGVVELHLFTENDHDGRPTHFPKSSHLSFCFWRFFTQPKRHGRLLWLGKFFFQWDGKKKPSKKAF